MSYFRPNIDRLTGYQPGKQPTTNDFIKLNTNENPYPPPPAVMEALRTAVDERLRLYPSPMAEDLRRAAARAYGFPPEMVLVANGSDDVLTMILRSFVGPNDRVVYPYPSYVLYETLTGIQDGVLTPVDFNEDYSLPDGVVVPDAKVTFVANPNSPSGTVVSAQRLSALAQNIDGVLVVDEAYVDFAEDNCLHLARGHENVIVLRSFSKSFSLAGIRLGLAFASPELINGLIKVKDSYNVNRLSVAAGVAALENIAAMHENAARIKRTRERLSTELRRLGFYVYPSQSNFVLARWRNAPEAKQLQSELEARRILVRYFDQRRLDDCLRISIGTEREVGELLRHLRQLVQKAPSQD